MANLFALIQNENMKIYRRIGTWVMIGILIVGMIVAAILSAKYSGKPENWKAELASSSQQLEADVANQGMPKTIRDQLSSQLEINNYRLEHDIAPPHNASLWGFAINAIDFFQLITIFTVIVAAGTVASEFSWGTIKLLMIRPAGRWKILLSKYISTILYSLLLMTILLIFSILIGGIVNGFDKMSLPHLVYQDGQVVERAMLVHLLSIYGLNSINLIMLVTFAFMISSVFRSSSLAIGLAIFLMFVGGNITFLLASKFEWAKYILFANTDLTQYIDGIPMVEGMTLSFSITMLIIYFVVFNALSWLIFQKRDIAA